MVGSGHEAKVTLAKQVVTGRLGDHPWDAEIIKDAAIVSDDGICKWIGPRDDLPDEYWAVDGGVESGCVVPGLVDAHTHLVFGGDRYDDFEKRSQGKSYAEIAASGGGIKRTVELTRNATWESLQDGLVRRAFQAKLAGTRLVEVKSGYGLEHDAEIRLLDAANSLLPHMPRTVTYLGLHAIPEGRTKEDYMDEVFRRTLPEIHKRKLADAVDIFVEDGYYNADDARRLAQAAKQYGLDLRMHVDQFGDHGGARLAAELGAKTADHLEYTGDDGIRALADAGVIPVLLPASVFGLGLSKYPDARKMIEAGLPVVLATDCNPGSSPTLSLPMVMAIACRYMKMTPMEALVACTRNAARALNLEHEFGTIEVGKRAAFHVLPEPDYRSLACWF
ncbi:MAG: Imidazolonepropionase [Fimbriimonadaceae bacterium]|nr:Imidazolonepropionase [Fimbriimonadaceae bacterium]